jgi:hypothetical protein
MLQARVAWIVIIIAQASAVLHKLVQLVYNIGHSQVMAWVLDALESSCYDLEQPFFEE